MTAEGIIVNYLKAHSDNPITIEEILSELEDYGMQHFQILYSADTYRIRLKHFLDDKRLLQENKLIVGSVITKNCKKGIIIREL
jgi:hypothetical protein